MYPFFINGCYLSKEEAHISVVDLGLTRGFGVFEYLRTYQRRPFHLYEHLQRLRYSAEYIGLTLPYTLQEMNAIIETLIANSPPGEISIKILMTGGESADQFTPSTCPTFIAFTYPAPIYPDTFFSKGITVVTTLLPRSIPTCKTIHYIPAVMAMRLGKSRDAQEALHLNTNNEILEATTSNFFAFKEGKLITPQSEELLLGITREVVLTLAKDLFPIEYRALSYEELSFCEECFITSSSREVMPVIQINDLKIGSGSCGKQTQSLQKLFADYTQQALWPLLSIVRHEGKITSEETSTFMLTTHNFF